MNNQVFAVQPSFRCSSNTVLRFFVLALLLCQSLSAQLLPSEATEPERFGGASVGRDLAWGDFDGDGDQDLAVAHDLGVRFYTRTGDDLVLDPFAVDGDKPVLAVCDLEPSVPGEEIIVGLPFASVEISRGQLEQAGRVLVVSLTDGILADINQGDIGQTDVVLELKDNFGGAIAVGDFTANGQCDVAIAAPGENAGAIEKAGSVHVMLGPLSSNFWLPQVTQGDGASELPGVDEHNDQLGSTLHVANVAGQSHDELIIGAPNEDIFFGGKTYPNAGAFWIVSYDGSAPAFDVEGAQLITSLDLDVGLSDHARFGGALASGDLFGGFATHRHLAIGSPGALDGAGFVAILEGTFPFPIPTTPAFLLTTQSDQEGLTPDDGFGTDIAFGDFDGDNLDGVLIGAPGRNGDSGSVYLFESRSETLVQYAEFTYGQLPGQNQGTSNPLGFGSSFAVSGPNNLGTDELAIGTPLSAQLREGETEVANRGEPFEAVKIVPSAGRLRQVEIVVKAGDIVGDTRGGVAFRIFSNPTTNLNGDLVFWAEDEVGVDYAMRSDLTFVASGEISRNSVGIAEDGTMSWIDIERGQIRLGNRVILSEGDPLPSGEGLSLSTAHRLQTRGNDRLFLIEEGSLLKLDEDSGIEVLLAPGDLVGVSEVTAVSKVAAAHDGSSYLASAYDLQGDLVAVKNGVLAWHPDDALRGFTAGLKSLAHSDSWDLIAVQGTDAQYFVETADHEPVMDNSDDIEGFSLLNFGLFSASSLSPRGELLTRWSGGSNQVVLHCLDTGNPPRVILRTGDRFSTTGSPIADATVNIVSGDPAELAPDGKAFTVGTILIDGETDQRRALLSVESGGCGVFGDGFESGDVGAWL